jgi:hypothetical protein
MLPLALQAMFMATDKCVLENVHCIWKVRVWLNYKFQHNVVNYGSWHNVTSFRFWTVGTDRKCDLLHQVSFVLIKSDYGGAYKTHRTCTERTKPHNIAFTTLRHQPMLIVLLCTVTDFRPWRFPVSKKLSTVVRS